MKNNSNLFAAGQSPIQTPRAVAAWTETPNWILDEAAPTLDGAPLKVLLYITRRTRGFHRESDAISLDQFTGGIVTHDGRQLDHGCGVRNRSTVVKALGALEHRGYIGRAHGRPGRGKDATTLYFLREPATDASPRGPVSAPHPASVGNAGVQSAHPNGVHSAHPQKKGVKQSSYENDTIAPAREKQKDHGATMAVTVDQDTPLQPQPAETTDSAPPSSPPSASMPLADDTGVQAITLAIGALSVELGDQTPQASQTHAQTVRRAAALSAPAFLALLGEAASRTRAYKPGISARQRDGRMKAMPYLFAVLHDLLDHQHTDTSGSGECAPLPLSVAPGVGSVADDDVLPEGDPTWRAALAEVRTSVTAENYERWFKPTSVIRHDEKRNELFIAVPDAFHQQWLDRRLRGCIERALARVVPEVRVTFVVVDPTTPAEGNPARSTTVQDV